MSCHAASTISFPLSMFIPQTKVEMLLQWLGRSGRSCRVVDDELHASSAGGGITDLGASGAGHSGVGNVYALSLSVGRAAVMTQRLVLRSSHMRNVHKGRAGPPQGAFPRISNGFPVLDHFTQDKKNCPDVALMPGCCRASPYQSSGIGGHRAPSAMRTIIDDRRSRYHHPLRRTQ